MAEKLVEMRADLMAEMRADEMVVSKVYPKVEQ